MPRRILAVLAVVGLLASCNASRNNESEPTEPIHLVMYLIGTEPELHDQFEATLNRYLLEDFNATMDVRYLDWSNLASEYHLIFVSHEQVDLIYTAHWCFYTDIAHEGGFARLDDMIADRPAIRDSIPDEAWDLARVDGSVYAVPANQRQFATQGFIYRKDLLEGPITIDSLDSLERYMSAIVEQTDLIPLDIGRSDGFRMSLIYPRMHGYLMLPITQARIVLNPDGDGPVLLSLAETDGYPEFLRMMRRWAMEGFWRPDVVNRNTESWVSFEEGESAVAFSLPTEARDLAERILAVHPDWELGYWPLSDVQGVGGYLSPMQDAMAIGSSSEHPELAMDILETIRTDRRYFDLFFYGIPSIHYVANDSGQFRLIEGAAGWNMCNWGFRNAAMERPRDWLWDEWDVIRSRLESYSTYDRFSAFVPDLSDVSEIGGRLNDLQVSLHDPLLFGAFADPDAVLAEYIEEMNEAGFRTYLDELSEQVETYLADQ